MFNKYFLFIVTAVAMFLGLGAIYSCSPTASSGVAAATTVTITMKGAAQ